MNQPRYRISRPALHLPVLAHLTTRLLRDRIPLTLLLDLTEPGGPNSTALLLAEGAADLTGGLCADIDWSDNAPLDTTFGYAGPAAPNYETPRRRGQQTPLATST